MRVQFSGTYASFQEAAESAQTYEDTSLIDIQIRGMRQRRRTPKQSSGSMAFYGALSAAWLRLPHQGLRVCDVGGGLGGHFFLTSEVLAGGRLLTWDVVETPAMAKAGREFEVPGLRFHDSLEAVRDREYDVVLCSGTLQYVPDPQGFFAEIAALRHRFLLLDRVPALSPLNQHENDRIVLQSINHDGCDVRIPHRFFALRSWGARFAATHNTDIYWEDVFDGVHRLEDGTLGCYFGLLLAKK